MKSERAEDYLISHECGYPMDGYVPLMYAGRAVEIAEEEVEECVLTELTRWRDPREELPPASHTVLLKIDTAYDGSNVYSVGFHSGQHWFGDGLGVFDIVVGWREIHEYHA